MKNKLRSTALKMLAISIFLAPGPAKIASAVEPPDEGMALRAGAAGGADMSSQSFSPDLVAGLGQRYLGTKQLLKRSFNLPASGSPKIFVLLIEFDEYPAKPEDTAEALKETLFGESGPAPLVSLSSFYRRSSYGKLNIQGDVFAWYKAGPRAAVKETTEGREELIKSALLNLGIKDLSAYDSDGKGLADYFIVLWTGPVGDWASFWWGSQGSFRDRDFAMGNTKLGLYAWMPVRKNWGGNNEYFSLRTVIHETGHALGLPDYYDYNPKTGPKGGLGGFDMMDSNYYDHNCFSKMVLGWVNPIPVQRGGVYTLPPASEKGDCLLLIPRGGYFPFGEYFLAENRGAYGPDSEKPLGGGGVVIWHVDARLNEAGLAFANDNSTSDRKLLKILEADGLEQLETAENAKFDADDLYLPGRALNKDTVPSSSFYDGSPTDFEVVSMGAGSGSKLMVSFN